MAYNENLAERIRERLVDVKKVKEVRMMGGLTFMVDGKMCVGIIKGDLMCRIDPTLHDESIEKTGCRTMDFTRRPMSGFIMVDESGTKSKKMFDYWIDLALDFNSKVMASPKKKSKPIKAKKKSKR
jgi:TfoX/Sxy family transcriptional regulator of competence genes